MSDAEFIANFDAMKAKRGATGLLLTRASIAVSGLVAAVNGVAIYEKMLAKAKMKADIAAEWAEFLPEDAAETAADVIATEQKLVEMRASRGRARAAAEIAVAAYVAQRSA